MGNDSATKPQAGLGVTVIRKDKQPRPVTESTGKTFASLLFGLGVLVVVVQAWLWEPRLGVILTGAMLAVIGLAHSR
jgi:hypothetical protein